MAVELGGTVVVREGVRRGIDAQPGACGPEHAVAPHGASALVRDELRITRRRRDRRGVGDLADELLGLRRVHPRTVALARIVGICDAGRRRVRRRRGVGRGPGVDLDVIVSGDIVTVGAAAGREGQGDGRERDAREAGAGRAGLLDRHRAAP